MVLNKVLLILALMSILFGLILIPTYSAQAQGTIGMTTVTRFFPTGVSDASALQGDCWETSLAAPRLDAWRCIVKNTIYDPCFSAVDYNKYVICDANPATDTRGIKVMLTRSLPASSGTAESQQPWVLRLANGEVCTFLTGATSIVDDQRVNYGCTNNALIIGSPKQGNVWTVNEKFPGQNLVVTASVVQAWI